MCGGKILVGAKPEWPVSDQFGAGLYVLDPTIVAFKFLFLKFTFYNSNAFQRNKYRLGWNLLEDMI